MAAAERLTAFDRPALIAWALGIGTFRSSTPNGPPGHCHAHGERPSTTPAPSCKSINRGVWQRY
jgi:hypothetical protein